MALYWGCWMMDSVAMLDTLIFSLCIEPLRALCHYNLVTGTNKQSYSNLTY